MFRFSQLYFHITIDFASQLFLGKDIKVRFCFEQLYWCLLNKKYEGRWEEQTSLKDVRKAISLKLEGLKLFTMARCYWDDFFRIALICDDHKKTLQTFVIDELTKVQPFYDKKTLLKVRDFFANPMESTYNVIEKTYLDDLRFKEQLEFVSHLQSYESILKLLSHRQE